MDSLRAAACTVHVETLLIYAISLMTIQDMEKVDVVTKELDNRHEQDGWKDKDEHAELVSILISLKAYVHLALGNLDTFIELITKQVNRGLTNGKWYHAPVHYNLYHAKLTRTPLGTKGNYSSISDIRAFF